MLDKVQNVTKEQIMAAAVILIRKLSYFSCRNKDIADKLIQFDVDQKIDFYDYNAEPVK